MLHQFTFSYSTLITLVSCTSWKFHFYFFVIIISLQIELTAVEASNEHMKVPRIMSIDYETCICWKYAKTEFKLNIRVLNYEIKTIDYSLCYKSITIAAYRIWKSIWKCSLTNHLLSVHDKKIILVLWYF